MIRQTLQRQCSAKFQLHCLQAMTVDCLASSRQKSPLILQWGRLSAGWEVLDMKLDFAIRSRPIDLECEWSSWWSCSCMLRRRILLVGPGANTEYGSSLIILWNSGSHKISTNWANQYDIYFGGGPTGGAPAKINVLISQVRWYFEPTGGGPGPCPLDLLNPALMLRCCLWMVSRKQSRRRTHEFLVTPTCAQGSSQLRHKAAPEPK